MALLYRLSATCFLLVTRVFASRMFHVFVSVAAGNKFPFLVETLRRDFDLAATPRFYLRPYDVSLSTLIVVRYFQV